MLGNFYYNAIIRKTVVAFGSMFSDLKLNRFLPDGKLEQVIAVPIAYAPKDKTLVRLRQDPNLNNKVLIDLPRMSFEINGYVYDPLFAEAKSYSKYYGATYGSYGLYPVLKYKIS